MPVHRHGHLTVDWTHILWDELPEGVAQCPRCGDVVNEETGHGHLTARVPAELVDASSEEQLDGGAGIEYVCGACCQERADNSVIYHKNDKSPRGCGLFWLTVDYDPETGDVAEL